MSAENRTLALSDEKGKVIYMKRYLKWFQMLSLRLYKKPSFLAIIVIIPLCVIGFGIAAKGDSGFLHIVLAQSDASDEISSEIIDDLMHEDSMIRYSLANSPEDAEEAVKNGSADAAWIFPKDLGEKMNEFIDSSYFKDGFVKIVEKESSVPLRLSHEKLSAKLFRSLAEKYYLKFAKERTEYLSDLDDVKLMEYFYGVSINEELFEVTDVEGNAAVVNGSTSYLTSPVRGLLSIVVMLSGMAAAMFCIQDEKSGTFSWIAESKRIYVNFVCIFIAVINVATAALIAVCVGGLSYGFVRELAAMIMYSVCCAVFCLLLKQIFRTAKVYGSMIPLFVIVMIAVCPIFFDLKNIGWAMYLFPPSIYIKSAYNGMCFVYMIIYIIAAGALCIALDKLSRKRIIKIK